MRSCSDSVIRYNGWAALDLDANMLNATLNIRPHHPVPFLAVLASVFEDGALIFSRFSPCVCALLNIHTHTMFRSYALMVCPELSLLPQCMRHFIAECAAKMPCAILLAGFKSCIF